MIKPGLQLGLSQQLKVTPQLRQALKLLQLSALELKENLGDALADNVMLEREDDDADGHDAVPAEEAAGDAADPAADLDIPAFEARHASGRRASGADMDEWRDRAASEEESLRDYLGWQLDLAHLSDADFAIGAVIIDSIDDHGYLAADLDDIAASTGNGTSRHEAEAVLRRIQHFDPPGVGARTLQECLRLQLATIADNNPGKAAAGAIIDHHLRDLADGNDRHIASTLQLSGAEVAAAARLIRELEPHPGGAVGGAPADYLIPDVIVENRGNRWHCRVNPDAGYGIRINPVYERCLREHRGKSDQAPLRQQLEEARWLLRSLAMRRDTLLNVAEAVVMHQQAFLDFGEEAMQPLALKTIAERLDMHESTISRVCANKWLATPRGILPFRYFFSNAVSNGNACDHSSTAIRARIRKLIGDEDAARPLSDSRISSILKSQGVGVARRTIAKYRESLSIPPSHQRKC